MILAGSVWRKALVTLIAAGSFIALYEVTFLDSQNAAQQAELSMAPPSPGVRVPFAATAYCKGETTASGVAPQSGVAAADPELLPVGSVVHIDTLETRYAGIYTIMDTGPSVQGRQVDLYMWSCVEALHFGRRPIRLLVLRLGWNPRATTATLLNRFFKRPDVAPARSSSLPARALQLPLAETPAH
jgi:3D (Asp-Asp-Asp) domain-containing protein